MKQLPVVLKMQIYLPFQHNILSPHSLKHFLHHLMYQGHTSDKRRGKGQLHVGKLRTVLDIKPLQGDQYSAEGDCLTMTFL